MMDEKLKAKLESKAEKFATGFLSKDIIMMLFEEGINTKELHEIDEMLLHLEEKEKMRNHDKAT